MTFCKIGAVFGREGQDTYEYTTRGDSDSVLEAVRRMRRRHQRGFHPPLLHWQLVGLRKVFLITTSGERREIRFQDIRKPQGLT